MVCCCPLPLLLPPMPSMPPMHIHPQVGLNALTGGSMASAASTEYVSSHTVSGVVIHGCSAQELSSGQGTLNDCMGVCILTPQTPPLITYVEPELPPLRLLLHVLPQTLCHSKSDATHHSQSMRLCSAEFVRGGTPCFPSHHQKQNKSFSPPKTA